MTNNQEMAPWENVPFDSPLDDDAESFGVAPKGNDLSLEEDTEEVPPEKVPLIDEIATEFVGSWNRLVSQTNWEKGKVIHTWRIRLMEAGLPRAVYSDDTIAKRIGNVSGQHVGRLRRVYEQFGQAEVDANLFWSHYQAALDWDDAADWLTKAAQEGLSVAAMRLARWEKYGAPTDRKPKENEIIVSELDEDVNPYNDSQGGTSESAYIRDDSSGEKKERRSSSEGKIHDPDDVQPSTRSASPPSTTPGDSALPSSGQTTGDVINTLNKMAPLPDDLTDAFEHLKIAILNHKLTNWSSVESDLLLSYLSVMRALVLVNDKG